MSFQLRVNPQYPQHLLISTCSTHVFLHVLDKKILILTLLISAWGVQRECLKNRLQVLIKTTTENYISEWNSFVCVCVYVWAYQQFQYLSREYSWCYAPSVTDVRFNMLIEKQWGLGINSQLIFILNLKTAGMLLCKTNHAFWVHTGWICSLPP